MSTFNTAGLAAECLRSMRANLGIDGVEVIVFDNASDTFDADDVLQAWPGAHITRSSNNIGPGPADNISVRRATGEYIWLMNTDTLIPADNNVTSLLDFLDANPEYAAAAPLLTDADGTVQPWQIGPHPTLGRMAASSVVRTLAKFVPGLASRLSRIDRKDPPAQATDVEQLVTAACVMRREAFEAVGGYSLEYRFFLDDTDLCRKLHEAGWRIRWMPEAHVIHFVGGSGGGSDERRRLYLFDQDRYFRRWHSTAELWLLRALRAPAYVRVYLARWRTPPGQRTSPAPPALSKPLD